MTRGHGCVKSTLTSILTLALTICLFPSPLPLLTGFSPSSIRSYLPVLVRGPSSSWQMRGHSFQTQKPIKNTPCNYSQVCLSVPLGHQGLCLLCSQSQAVADCTNLRPNHGDAHRNKALRSDSDISLGPWHDSRPIRSLSRRI